MMAEQREPDAQGAPVRRFRDPGYRPLAANLAGVRAGIDRIDDQIVRLLAERAMLVKDAARFKRDAFQVSAPARQAQVFEHVRELARRHAPDFNGGFDGLPGVVEAAYRALVAGYIGCEQSYFGHTEEINPASKEDSQ
ncbi:MAG: pchB [Ramlibacter sp.]|jgi:isochorismate pyruvate lyase|uniref:chorismate mutase n=1 Tax=Ramlibacter sp. TaxID=1917967 RepID=UPI002627A216|nr:chorismate mutase [Ramlibacter sp.]MDB5750129.1 pchB [Ramlibacter sp.]